MHDGPELRCVLVARCEVRHCEVPTTGCHCFVLIAHVQHSGRQCVPGALLHVHALVHRTEVAGHSNGLLGLRFRHCRVAAHPDRYRCWRRLCQHCPLHPSSSWRARPNKSRASCQRWTERQVLRNLLRPGLQRLRPAPRRRHLLPLPLHSLQRRKRRGKQAFPVEMARGNASHAAARRLAHEQVLQAERTVAGQAPVQEVVTTSEYLYRTGRLPSLAKDRNRPRNGGYAVSCSCRDVTHPLPVLQGGQEWDRTLNFSAKALKFTKNWCPGGHLYPPRDKDQRCPVVDRWSQELKGA